MTSATFSTSFSMSIEAQQAAALMEGYRFELGHHDARQWVSLWLEFYRPAWIRDAVVEALYQGRYKSISVRQILELWQRRGQPIRHVTHDFEAAVCREFGEVKLTPAAPTHSSPQRLAGRADRPLLPASTVSFDLSAKSGEIMSSEISSGKANGSAYHHERDAAGRLRSAYSAADTQEILQDHLQDQRSANGVLYTSARAIQPFKPALPFSAQTLRLAKQKALA
jgi:hypothetical protein